MRFLMLLVVFAVTVDISTCSWWRRVWRAVKGPLISVGAVALLGKRDINAMDANGDGLLDSEELSHLDQRDVEALRTNMDLDDNEVMKTEDLKRFIDVAME